jgi:ketosteroid isomerase-like protein
MTSRELENEATLARLAEGFRTRDVDAILAEFADDGLFLVAAGPEPCGERFQGKAAIRTVTRKDTFLKQIASRA